MTSMRCISTTLVLALALPLLAPVARGQSEQGDWTITRTRRSYGGAARDSVQLTLMREENGISSFPVALARLRGLSADALSGPPAASRFELASDAGTVSFTGHVGGGTGSGQFSFAPQRAFVDVLHRRGVTGTVSDHDLYRLAIIGTTTASVDALLATLRRYDDALPSGPELVRFATHDVTAQVVADLGDAGLRRLTPEEIVRLVNHEVDGRYVRAWHDAGYRDLAVEELVRLRNHEVTPEFAKQVNERTGTRVGVQQLVRLRRDR
jgi:hypothetical protein